MTRFLFGSVVVLAVFTFSGCSGGGENKVIDQSDAEEYNIPPGEMEKAMKDAAKDARGGKK